MNDLISLAIHNACDAFEPGGKTFNAAGLSQELTRLANLNAAVDGRLVRVILTGRPDVKVLPGGSHYERVDGALPDAPPSPQGQPAPVEMTPESPLVPETLVPAFITEKGHEAQTVPFSKIEITELLAPRLFIVSWCGAFYVAYSGARSVSGEAAFDYLVLARTSSVSLALFKDGKGTVQDMFGRYQPSVSIVQVQALTESDFKGGKREPLKVWSILWEDVPASFRPSVSVVSPVKDVSAKDFEEAPKDIEGSCPFPGAKAAEIGGYGKALKTFTFFKNTKAALFVATNIDNGDKYLGYQVASEPEGMYVIMSFVMGGVLNDMKKGEVPLRDVLCRADKVARIALVEQPEKGVIRVQKGWTVPWECIPEEKLPLDGSRLIKEGGRYRLSARRG